MTASFDPPAGDWTRVSTQLRSLHRTVALAVCAFVAAPATVVLIIIGTAPWLSALPVVVALGVAAWAWSWASRNWAGWGYAENAEDLLVTSGVMWRRLVAVPYGRTQYVDVKAGPLQRAFGIATVTLHTASSETAAHIPGLPATEATRLRNRLTELGESRDAGL
jgi:membrane protein YdbS with pleckstrin-like domain